MSGKRLNYSDETENLCFQGIFKLVPRNVELKIIKSEVIFGTFLSLPAFPPKYTSCCAYFLLFVLPTDELFPGQFFEPPSLKWLSSDSPACFLWRALRSHAVRLVFGGGGSGVYLHSCACCLLQPWSLGHQSGGTEWMGEVCVSPGAELGRKEQRLPQQFLAMKGIVMSSIFLDEAGTEPALALHDQWDHRYGSRMTWWLRAYLIRNKCMTGSSVDPGNWSEWRGLFTSLLSVVSVADVYTQRATSQMRMSYSFVLIESSVRLPYLQQRFGRHSWHFCLFPAFPYFPGSWHFNYSGCNWLFFFFF